MARLPLVLSAYNPARTAVAERGGREKPSSICTFCTLETGRVAETLLVAGDDAKSVSATACPLCALSHHLGDDTIDQDALLIWLPETSQSVLNLLVRHIHMVCVAHGDSPRLEDATRPAAAERVRAGRQSYLALQDRSSAAASRLGTSSPRRLGEALTQFDATNYARRHEILAGARLLSTGKLHRGGDNVYSGLVQAWIGGSNFLEGARRS